MQCWAEVAIFDTSILAPHVVISFAACQELTRLRVHIQVLDLSGCRRVTDDGMVAVARACPQLQELNISSCHLITDDGFAAIGACCWQLRVLKACGCDRLTDMGLVGLVSGARYV